MTEEELFEKLKNEKNPFRFCSIASKGFTATVAKIVHANFALRFVKNFEETKRISDEHPKMFGDNIPLETKIERWEMLQSGLLLFFEILEQHPEHLEE